MLWLITGPTCAGKSTFLTSKRLEDLTGLQPHTPVVWARRLLHQAQLPSGDCLIHYNILRPRPGQKLTEEHAVHRMPGWFIYDHLKHLLKACTGRPARGQEPPAIQPVLDFDSDRAWNVICQQEASKKAIVLIAKRRTLLQRLANRQLMEKRELSQREEEKYDSRYWLNFYENVDLVELYQSWCLALERQNIPYVLVDSNDDRYQVMEDKNVLGSPEYALESKYTKQQVIDILANKRFPSHRVNVAYGLHTPGKDRRATRDLIFPQSLSGKSVLDVGCALGYFCFEAEKRGAQRVAGVELNEERFHRATLLKDITGSEITLMNQDIVKEPITDHFDYVLLLNVIHHLKDPIRVVKELASIADECMVIEFPTLGDPLFRGTANFGSLSSVEFNPLPLIGVSSLPGANQTFVFTPTALERILMDHDRLFERIDFLRSPTEGRMIAMCKKCGTSDARAESTQAVDQG